MRSSSSRSSSVELRKGLWTSEEDNRLRNCIAQFGEGKWHLVPNRSGLNRCRKSCRLRWLNYLKPDIKRGDFSSEEVDLMIRLHKLLGNRWSLIAGRLPGRTANDVKNYWNTNLVRKGVAIRGGRAIGAPPQEKVGNLAESDNGSAPPVTVKPRPRSFSKKAFNKNKNKNKDDSAVVDGMARKSSAPPSSSSSPPPPSSSVLLSRQYDKDGIMNDDYDQRINIWWDCLDPENPEIDIYDHHHFNTCPSSFGGGSGSTSIVDNDFSASLPPGPDPQLYYFSQFGQGEEVVVEEGGAAAAALGGDDDEEDLFGCSSSCSGLFSPDSDFWGLLS